MTISNEKWRWPTRALPKCVEAQLKAGSAGDAYGFHGFQVKGDAARAISAEAEMIGKLTGVKKIKGNEKDVICISSNNDRALMAFALKQQRAEHSLSVRDVAAKLGSKSPTSYSRYESGRVGLTLDKFSQLLRAIDPGLEPILKIG